MNESQDNSNRLLDTTDCLEAVGVFRGWKNFLFAIVILCLLLLQASFWLVDTGYIKTTSIETDNAAKSSSPVAVAEGTEQTNEVTKQIAEETDKIQEAAKQVAAEPNQPAKAISQKPQKPQQRKTSLGFDIKFEQLAWLIRLLNFMLIPSAVLYCLTILFSLKVSLLGRLGGINHISRAFFLSLVMLVLLLPWQRLFTGIVVGAMYSSEELLDSYLASDGRGIFGTAFYYLRFTGFWLLAVLLLILSQFRSGRWTKTILRRLEVI